MIAGFIDTDCKFWTNCTPSADIIVNGICSPVPGRGGEATLINVHLTLGPCPTWPAGTDVGGYAEATILTGSIAYGYKIKAGIRLGIDKASVFEGDLREHFNPSPSYC